MEPLWVPITPTTGDLYEIKMFIALLTNNENFINGIAYWSKQNHFDTNKIALGLIESHQEAPKRELKQYLEQYLKQLYRPYTHILWVNKH